MSAPVDSLKKVVRRFADHFGCQVQERESDLWEIHLSTDLARRVKTKRWVLCFHRDLLGADPDAQLVAPGSPALQTMREALDGEPVASEAWLQPTVTIPPGPPPAFSAVRGALSEANREVVWSTLVRVYFRLSMLGTRRHEESFPLDLDPQTGLPVGDRLRKILEATRLSPNGGGTTVDLPKGVLDRAFEQAELLVAPLLVEVEDELSRAAQAEVDQAEAFFAETLHDATRPDERLRLLEFQKTRLAEIRQRHQVQAELEPRGAVLFRIPSQKSTLLLEDGHHRRSFEVQVNLLDNKTSAPVCPHHGGTVVRELRRVALCPTHGLHCEACDWACSSCGRGGCPACRHLRCPDCQGWHCEACTVDCPGCGQPVGRTHQIQCSQGCGAICARCRLDVESRPHCPKCAEACDCGHATRRGAARRSGYSGLSYCAACATRELATCARCGHTVEKSCLATCAGGGEALCPKCSVKLHDGRTACASHASDCRCGRKVLAQQISRCRCGAGVCPGCTVTTPSGPGCTACTVTCWRCSGSELRAKATLCGYCGEPACTLCAPHLDSCGTCGRKACHKNQHLGTCLGSEPVCHDCSKPCPTCGTRLCANHGQDCLGCGARLCPAHTGRCQLCGVPLCPACLPGEHCACCSDLKDLPPTSREMLREKLSLLEQHGHRVSGYRKVRWAMRTRYLVLVFEWFLGGQEFYCIGPSDRILSARRRNWLAVRLDRPTEPIR